MKKELYNVGNGVRVSESLPIKNIFPQESVDYLSLSYNGILALCIDVSYGISQVCRYVIQFTDLNNNRQLRVKLRDWSTIAFYDNMALLVSYDKPLREAVVESVFEKPTIDTFKVIEGTKDANPNTDVSLLHKKRILYYITKENKLFSFNVDTRENVEINVGRKVWSIGTLTGIDCGVKTVFHGFGKATFSLNNDNTVTRVSERHQLNLSTIFPSSSNPKNIKEAVFHHGREIFKGKNKVSTKHIIKFEWSTVIRVYRDVFITYDLYTNEWGLFRFIVT